MVSSVAAAGGLAARTGPAAWYAAGMHRPFAAAARAAALAIALAAFPAAAQAQTGAAPPANPPAADGGLPEGTPAPAAKKPTAGGRYFAGQDDRWTVGGSWLIRRDQGDVGRAAHWERPGSAAGWKAGTVPSVWTVGDNSPESQAGGVVWYRRELQLPTVAKARSGGRWILRFERVSVSATVWVNGHKLGSHRGAYEPFELSIPASAVKRDGKVTLVVRTDSRRGLGDFPPGSRQKDGTPGGGWWNDGGIPREVTLRYADQLDLSPVQITPDLPCATCAGVVRYRVTVTNVTGGTRKAEVVARIGTRSRSLGKVKLKGGASQELTGRIDVPKPKVWSPKHPTLYVTSVEASLTSGKRKGERVSRFRGRTGIRSIKVVAGRLQLNFVNVNLRGTGIHEMDEAHGSAMTDKGQDLLLRQARQLGLVIRAHYPLHPRILERADREGLLVWTEIPVYQVRQSQLRKHWVRDAAIGLLKTTIQTNAYHPSVFTWSVANELTTNPGRPIERYFEDARKLTDELDRTRPLSYARQSGVKYGCIGIYGMFDLLGLNDYFGWYGGPLDPLADPNQLGPFLDSLRACSPHEAIMITETGAEANRDGPATEAGTYGFQAAYAAYHYAVYASRPWLSGAVWWGLREFRVRPNWAGGNPLPTPPWHGKGLIDRRGVAKPAWKVLRDELQGVDELAPASTAPVTIPPSPPGRMSDNGTGEDGDPGAPVGDGAASPGG